MNYSKSYTPERSLRAYFIRKLPIIMAFLIPVFLLLILYIGRSIFPFGENMYLRSDMYHQYAPFMREFQRNIQHGGSLLYSWNIGLGNNFASTYAYYLASPANWLVGLFPDTLIPEFMNLMIILKSGLMSAIFSWYLIRKWKRNDYIATVFGCFYGMSSYMAAFSWNVMWLDCLVLFPLILIGLEALVREKKGRMYVITLAVCIISNYYISIMISIFLIFYFLYLLICEGRFQNLSEPIGRICHFIIASFLAGGMAMFVILPALFNLLITASANSSFPSSLVAYYNLLEMLSKAVINTEPAVFSGHFPNIYSTMALFFLVPLYWISRRVPVREKAGKTILVCILGISFMFNVPTFIWHGFHFPNSLPCRYSFIYIFLVLTMGNEALIQIRRFKTREIVITAALGVGSVFLLQMITQEEKFTVENASLGALFIVLYLVVALLLKQRRARKTAIMVLLLIVSVAEIMINTNETGYSITSRTTYMSDNASIRALLDQVEDDSFYRVEKVTRRTKNDGTWNDYRSASVFSSTTVSGNSDLYDDLGMQGRTNAYSFYGHTPLTQAMLGVKYELAADQQKDPLMTELALTDDLYLYQNRHALSLGYQVQEDLLDLDLTAQDPFELQNQWTQEATGVFGLYQILDNHSGDVVSFPVPADGRCLLYITSDIDSCSVEITRDGEALSQKSISSLETPQIVDAGEVEAGDEVTIISNDKENNHLSILPAVMDYERYEEAMKQLEEEQVQILEFTDTVVSGTIQSKPGHVLFTTIPYDEGWTMYVDGEKASYEGFAESFLVARLSPGEHQIEFRYWPLGMTLGIIISIAALCLFILLEIGKNIRKIRKNQL